MSPVEIEVLLRCYYANGEGLGDSWATRDAVQWLRSEGLIEPASLDTTDRGNAHVAQLKALPLPERVWVDSHGALIV